ncbi:hypothetical protein BZA77DRAFT_299579 [Pyronema omphalodes]|nr:hypothetical protein BZA77DRAFT_299579 [Pyronema omphalodes]
MMNNTTSLYIHRYPSAVSYSSNTLTSLTLHPSLTKLNIINCKPRIQHTRFVGFISRVCIQRHNSNLFNIPPLRTEFHQRRPTIKPSIGNLNSLLQSRFRLSLLKAYKPNIEVLIIQPCIRCKARNPHRYQVEGKVVVAIEKDHITEGTEETVWLGKNPFVVWCLCTRFIIDDVPVYSSGPLETFVNWVTAGKVADVEVVKLWMVSIGESSGMRMYIEDAGFVYWAKLLSFGGIERRTR